MYHKKDLKDKIKDIYSLRIMIEYCHKFNFYQEKKYAITKITQLYKTGYRYL